MNCSMLLNFYLKFPLINITSVSSVEKENLINDEFISTLIMFYKQRPNKETSWHMSSFDSRCLTVAYFLLKI